MIMRTICTFVCLVMLIITGISFIFIINPKRTKQIQSSFDLEQPIKDINGQNIQENLNLQKNTIVLFLNSDCDFCKQEIDFIDKNIDIFKSKHCCPLKFSVVRFAYPQCHLIGIAGVCFVW